MSISLKNPVIWTIPPLIQNNPKPRVRIIYLYLIQFIRRFRKKDKYILRGMTRRTISSLMRKTNQKVIEALWLKTMDLWKKKYLSSVMMIVHSLKLSRFLKKVLFEYDIVYLLEFSLTFWFWYSYKNIKSINISTYPLLHFFNK